MNTLCKENLISQIKMTDELYHHGVLGMKWGVRRYQPYGHGGYNPDHKGKFVGDSHTSATGTGYHGAKDKSRGKTAAKIAGAGAAVGAVGVAAKKGYDLYKKSRMARAAAAAALPMRSQQLALPMAGFHGAKKKEFSRPKVSGMTKVATVGNGVLGASVSGLKAYDKYGGNASKVARATISGAARGALGGYLGGRALDYTKDAIRRKKRNSR